MELNQRSGYESTHTWEQMIFDKDAKIIEWKKERICNK